MKTFIQFLNEGSRGLRRALRAAKKLGPARRTTDILDTQTLSEPYSDYPLTSGPARSAMNKRVEDIKKTSLRLKARAMTKSMDNDHLSASAIGYGVDRILRDPKNPTRYAEYFARGPAADIHKQRVMWGDFAKEINSRRRSEPEEEGGGGMSTLPPISSLSKSTSSKYDSGDSDKKITLRHHSIPMKNLHGHIERSRFAGALERAGFKASDAPPFVPMSLTMFKSSRKKYPPFKKGKYDDNPPMNDNRDSNNPPDHPWTNNPWDHPL